MLNLEEVFNFHPLYNDFKEQSFDIYFAQTFIRKSDTAKIELVLDKGYFVTPESYSDVARYVDKDTLITKKGETIKETKDISVVLSFIGFNDDRYMKQGKGSELLEWFTGCLDKYDYACTLSVDNQFGVPVSTLKKWYRRFGFVEVNSDAMIRPKKSIREKSFNIIDIEEVLYENSEWMESVMSRTIKEFYGADEQRYRDYDIPYFKHIKDNVNKMWGISEDEDAIAGSIMNIIYHNLISILDYAEYLEEGNDELEEVANNLKSLLGIKKY